MNVKHSLNETHPYNWLRKHPIVSLIVILTVFIRLFLVLAPIFKWSQDKSVLGITLETLRHVTYLVQAVVILLLVLLAGTSPFTDRDDRHRTENIAVQQFHRAWQGLWCTWLAYYVAASIHAFNSSMNSQFRYWDPVMTLFNNLQALFLIACYWILSRRTVGYPNQGSKDEPARIPYLQMAVLVSLLFILQVYYTSGCNDCWRYEISTLDDQWRLIFHLTSGLAVAIALALFVSRLASMYLDAPQGIIILLYLYSSIQPLYVLFGKSKPPLLEETVSTASLALKLLLFSFVSGLLVPDEGDNKSRLFFYFFKIRRLYANIPTIWRQTNLAAEVTAKALADKLQLTSDQTERLRNALDNRDIEIEVLIQDDSVSREDKQKKLEDLEIATVSKIHNFLTEDQKKQMDKLDHKTGGLGDLFAYAKGAS